MNLRQNLSRSGEVLGAYFRQGLHELGSVFYGHGTAVQHAEYGMLGTRTPGQVADGLRANDTVTPARDNEPSQLDAHLQQAHDRDVPEPEPEIEVDRE